MQKPNSLPQLSKQRFQFLEFDEALIHHTPKVSGVQIRTLVDSVKKWGGHDRGGYT